MDFEFRDWVYIGTVIFAAGILYAKLGSVQATVDKIQVTLFGHDGRNGVVGDLHDVKGHVAYCRDKERCER